MEPIMSLRNATEFQGAFPSPPLPPDHVLNSGAVVFPGAFDQHGCPLVMFPVDAHGNLSDLRKSEVVDFIHYFQCLHNKNQEKGSLVSIVADLRQATLTTTRFIVETILLLELHTRTVHTTYIIQPKMKDVLKLLLKLMVPTKNYVAPFKKVLLKEVFELSNYIDRSQLTASLGGYLVYCHRSWVAFIKEIDAFVQEFLSVVQRLPSCLTVLQTLSRQQVPSEFSELKDFCSTNEAKFQMLRRELGLDELLLHCEHLVEKLRYPENDLCYQAMARTALFNHTTFDMLQNYSRITAAVEKIELLWQQAFSKAHLQLHVFLLREEAQQITEKIKSIQDAKLQPYRIEIAKDAGRAEMLSSEFEASIYTPAMALVRCSEDVIHTLLERLTPMGAQTLEDWVQELDRLKENFKSAVELPYQTLRTVSDFYHYHNKANSWYRNVLCENLLQDLLWAVNCDSTKRRHSLEMHGSVPVWNQVVCDFLRNNPSPEMKELVLLAHFSNIIPDAHLQRAGKRLSRRCVTLHKLLTSPGAVPVNCLQVALQWQYEFLRGNPRDSTRPENNLAVDKEPRSTQDSQNPCHRSRTAGSRLDCNQKDSMPSHGSFSSLKQHPAPQGRSPPNAVLEATAGKPPSLSSFDSGFDGAGSSHVEVSAGWEGLSRIPGTRDSFRPVTRQPKIHEENLSSVSDSEDHGVEFDFDTPGANVQIIPKITLDSLNFEIKLKRSASLPQNPWLSLPVDDLENSYTVTITQNPSPRKQDDRCPNPSEGSHRTDQSSTRSRDQPTQTELHAQPESRETRDSDCLLQADDSFEASELSPLQNVLSSTVTESGDGPNYTTDSVPTMIWDTYDFHNPMQNTCERITSSMTDVSLNDWDLREQEGLQKVEDILDWTAGILEEEEKVMQQEQMLDVLLKTESTSNPWTPWGSAEQMSSSDLKAQGVLGLDDSLVSADSDSHSECRSPEAATENSEDGEGRSGNMVEMVPTWQLTPLSHKVEMLKELRGLHVLDELIVEENLKIHELRAASENTDGTMPQSAGSGCTSEERQAFLLDLEREKMEVERMEEHLQEVTHECQIKKQLSRTKKVMKCPAVEKATKLKHSEDGDFISNCKSQCDEVKHLPTLPLDTTVFGSKQSLGITETLYATAPVSQDFVQSVNVPSRLADSNVSGGEEAFEGDSSRPCEFTEPSAPQPVFGPTQSRYTSIQQDVTLHEDTERGFDLKSGEIESCTTTACLTPETCLKQEAPDPCGESNSYPVPKPRKTSHAVKANSQQLKHQPDNDLDPIQVSQELNITPETEQMSLKLPNMCQCPNLKEHSGNHNNQHLVDLDTSFCSGLLQVSEQSTLDCCSLESALTPVDSDCVEIDGKLSQKPVVRADSDCDSEELNCSSEDTAGSREQIRIDQQRVEIPEGFQRCGSARMSPVNQPNVFLTTRDMTNFKTPIVLDTGSGLMKAGFANQDLPNTIFPNIIGLPKYEEVMNGNFERETYIGHAAQQMRGVLTLNYPMQNGIIRNWDEMEKIWHHTFQQLQVDTEDHPVLLTEAAMNPLENRERMVELMFECFNVPLTYVAMQAVLALYAAGRTTGVVFDSGDGVSHSVPVFEGYCLPHAVQRFTLAGHDVTLQLKKLLQEDGVCMRTTAEMEIVRDMKEKSCWVSLDYESELRCGSVRTETHYTMPDGQVVHLGTERFRAPEILFKPELIGRDHYGMHESIFKSILRSDIDLRRSFLGNIFLSGGNTLLTGLPERLQSEIRTMVPRELADCVRVTSPKDRDFSVWCGGAVLANLSSFGSAWISQEEYEEYGPQIVFRKCF